MNCSLTIFTIAAFVLFKCSFKVKISWFSCCFILVPSVYYLLHLVPLGFVFFVFVYRKKTLVSMCIFLEYPIFTYFKYAHLNMFFTTAICFCFVCFRNSSVLTLNVKCVCVFLFLLLLVCMEGLTKTSNKK